MKIFFSRVLFLFNYSSPNDITMNKFNGQIRYEFFPLELAIHQHKEFLTGQRKALGKYHLEHIVPQQFFLSHLKHTYAIIAFSKNVIIGGMKIHFKNIEQVLPSETVITKRYSSFGRKLSLLNPHGVAEFCSLWVDEAFSGYSIATKLIKKGFAITCARGYSTAFGFMGPAYKTALRAGFTIDPEIKPFPYPDERFLSRVVWRFENEKLSQLINKYEENAHPK